MTQPSVTDEMAAAFVAAHCANPDSIRASIAAAIAAMPPIRLPPLAPGSCDTYRWMYEDDVKRSIEQTGLRWAETP